MKIKASKFYLNCTEAFKVQGLMHVYATDINSHLLDCNNLQAKVITEMLQIKKPDFIGESLLNLFKNFGNFVDISIHENEKVLSSNITKQFYNILHIENNCRIEFLTTKMLLYDSRGKVSGVFGMSQYINKFSYTRALELGLSRKEIICLSSLLEGKSNKQVASELNISVRTVEDHVESIRDKLNCSGKHQLIFKAFQNNLMNNIDQKFMALRNIINFENEKNTNNLMLKSSNDLKIKLISTDIHNI